MALKLSDTMTQDDVIKMGKESGYDTSFYDMTNDDGEYVYNRSQMFSVLKGLEHGVDVSLYSRLNNDGVPCFNGTNMAAIERALFQGQDMSWLLQFDENGDCVFDSKQLSMIFYGKREGIDVSLYSGVNKKGRPCFDGNTMQEITTTLLCKKNIDLSPIFKYDENGDCVFTSKQIRKLLRYDCLSNGLLLKCAELKDDGTPLYSASQIDDIVKDYKDDVERRWQIRREEEQKGLPTVDVKSGKNLAKVNCSWSSDGIAIIKYVRDYDDKGVHCVIPELDTSRNIVCKICNKDGKYVMKQWKFDSFKKNVVETTREKERIQNLDAQLGEFDFDDDTNDNSIAFGD